MVDMFGRSEAWISRVCNATVEHIYRIFQQKIRWDSSILTFDRLALYAKAVHSKGGPDRIWGFVDGTLREISRPDTDELDQRDFYSGYNKAHCLKYQGLVTPDGLISSLIGPFFGKTGDFKAWATSGVPEKLQELMGHLSLDKWYFLFGDCAYKAHRDGIFGAITASVNRPLTAEELEFNTIMSKYRITVEQGFARITQLWQANGFLRGFCAGQSPVAAYYMVSVLLTNCMTCIRGGNQVSMYFDLAPPSIEDYLRAD